MPYKYYNLNKYLVLSTRWLQVSFLAEESRNIRAPELAKTLKDTQGASSRRAGGFYPKHAPVAHIRVYLQFPMLSS